MNRHPVIVQGKARVPVRGIVIHCTATPPNWRPDDTSAERVEAIRQMHICERGWRDIGYHWLIDRDGTVLPGRAETEIGAHVAGHNAGTLGLSLFGGLTSNPDDPFRRNFTAAQELALIRLIRGICRRTTITSLLGHNQLDAGKACPGFHVPTWAAAQGLD